MYYELKDDWVCRNLVDEDVSAEIVDLNNSLSIKMSNRVLPLQKDMRGIFRTKTMEEMGGIYLMRLNVANFFSGEDDY
jgi:hypothetical protein